LLFRLITARTFNPCVTQQRVETSFHSPFNFICWQGITYPTTATTAA